LMPTRFPGWTPTPGANPCVPRVYAWRVDAYYMYVLRALEPGWARPFFYYCLNNI
jgi:hypothetical protein